LSWAKLDELPALRKPESARMAIEIRETFEVAAPVERQLEAVPAAEGEAAPPPPASQPIRILPLLLKTLWAAIVRFFRRVT
jgi:hypothetical protein